MNTSDDTLSAVEAMDLFFINPLFNLHDDTEESNSPTNISNSNNFRWNLVDRIVTALPYSHTDRQSVPDHSGEVEVCMEDYVSCSPEDIHTKPLQRRIAVRAYGPIGHSGLTYASFSIPVDQLPPCDIKSHSLSKHWMCWATIHDDLLRNQKENIFHDADDMLSAPGKAYLCALTGPSTVRIFDVYPNITGNKSYEGAGGASDCHSITLDFIATSIFPLHLDQGGILIQRALSDRDVQNLGASIQSDSHEDIQGPPSTVRIRSISNHANSCLSGNNKHTEPRIESSFKINQMNDNLVYSLYTLHHPLDEIYPCFFDSGTSSSVMERVIFLDKPRYFTVTASSMSNSLLMVTYNLESRNHSIWVVDEAPIPSPALPLWKQTNSARTLYGSRNDGNFDNLGPFNFDFVSKHDHGNQNDPNILTMNSRVSSRLVYRMKHTEEQSEDVFLTTSEDATGDFIVCMKVKNGSSKHDFRCRGIVLIPPDNDSNSDWKIKEVFHIPCLSAKPLHSTKLAPRPFRISDGQKCFSLGKNQSNQRYIDLLVCQDPRLRKLSLYRGRTHILDFSVSPLRDFYQHLPKDLSNPVGDRVDIMFTNAHDQFRKFTTRFTFSTYIKNSGLTEVVMAAIGSSLIHSSYSDKNTRIGFIALQSDHSILSQALSRRKTFQEKSDDAEWDAFVKIISYLFVQAGGGILDDFALSKDMSLEHDYDSWGKMLNSKFHHAFPCEKFGFESTTSAQINVEQCLSNLDVRLLSSSKTSTWLKEKDSEFRLLYGRMIFDALHSLYEEFRCRRGSNSKSAYIRLGRLLLTISQNCKSSQGLPLMQDYSEKYIYDLNVESIKDPNSFTTPTIPNRLSLSITAPCIYRQLEICIKGGEISHDYFNGACIASGMLLYFYGILFSQTSDLDYGRRKHQLAAAMTDSGLYDHETMTNLFPTALVLPLLDALYWCRLNPSNDASPLCYKLISRNDLNKMHSPDGCNQKTIPPDSEIYQSFLSDDVDHDGLIQIEAFSAMMFPYDSRIKEAARLLRSSRPIFLRVLRQPEVNDHEYERLKQQKLAMLCRRLLPSPVGRGMLTFGTTKTIPVEPIVLPKLCLAGRVPPNDTIIFLEEARCQSKHKMWPEFHNGVAAGLCMPLAGTNGTKRVSRTWIVCNNPKVPATISNSNQTDPVPPEQETNHSFGGFLLALGLRGHLSSLSNTDILDYLNRGSITTSVGIILGLAAGKRGTSDVVVRKTICVHIPSLFPSSFRSIDLAVSLQTAAVMAVGLLYQESSDRLLSEFLLNEIGKRVTEDQSISDREGYSLCCGLSLGLVNLCLRGQASYDQIIDGLTDLNIEERLFRYINGGVDDSSLKQKKLERQKQLFHVNGEEEKSSRVFEGTMINTGLTSHGSTLALGLIYHRSGNASVSAMLSLPKTLFAMNGIRPDFLMIRAIARFLVLWDDIVPSQQWIENEIPSVIKIIYKKLVLRARKLSGFGDFNMQTDTANEEENEISEAEEDFLEIDHLAIRQSYTYIVAGLCFSIGLKYAGSGNEVAAVTITNYILELQKLRDESDPISATLRADKSTIETCLGSVAISLSMVMAGTGDLKVFNILRKLRQKCTADVKFGNHMAYASAIGLLFLGGGTYTLGNTPSDIAVLLISFYPIFPIFTHDNQYHLQALRHLYALAVKERKLVVIDVDTNEEVLIPVKISYDVDGDVETMAPCLILNKGKSCKIKTNTDRYYQVDLLIDNISELNRATVMYVKKKSGQLSHVKDPYGLRSLFSTINTGNDTLIDILLSFTDDRRFRAYAKHICDPSENASLSCSQEKVDRYESLAPRNHNFYNQALKEALRTKNVDAIFTYLALLDMVQESKMGFTQNIWSLKLLRIFYENGHSFNIVNPQFVAMLCENADRILSRFESEDYTTNLLRIWND